MDPYRTPAPPQRGRVRCEDCVHCGKGLLGNQLCNPHRSGIARGMCHEINLFGDCPCYNIPVDEFNQTFDRYVAQRNEQAAKLRQEQDVRKRREWWSQLFSRLGLPVAPDESSADPPTA